MTKLLFCNLVKNESVPSTLSQMHDVISNSAEKRNQTNYKWKTYDTSTETVDTSIETVVLRNFTDVITDHWTFRKGDSRQYTPLYTEQTKHLCESN